MIPRPVRNNNPGDLEHTAHGTDWMGQLPLHKMTPEQLAEPRFVVFASPEMGFRALVLLLHNYGCIYQCKNISDVVRKFAPPTENNSVAYELEVAHECGVHRFDKIDLNDRAFIFKLAKAMTRFETGRWEPYWNDHELKLGIGFTGMYPDEQVAA